MNGEAARPDVDPTDVTTLLARLADAEATLRAIRDGEVDALVVSTVEGERVYTLEPAGAGARVLLEHVHQGAGEVTPEGTLAYCNRHFAAMLRARAEGLVGVPLHALVAPESAPLLEAMLARAATGAAEGELMLRAADGTELPAHVVLRALPEPARALCLVASDLTAQKRHDELAASETLARSILEQAADAIIVCDERGRVVRASRGAVRLCRVDPLGQDFADVFGVDVPAERVSGVETEFGCPDGTRVTVLLSAAPLRAPDGRHQGTVLTLTDISGRKQTEEALRASEERYRRLVEASPDGIFVHTGARIVYANPALAKLVRAPHSGALVGTSPQALVPPESRAVACARAERVLRHAEETPRLEQTWRALDGSELEVEVMAHPLVWQGQPAAEVVVRDVTDRKRAAREREALLAAAERARAEAERANRAKDEFLATLAHELRNPLSAVRNAVLAGRLDSARRERALEIAWRQAEQLGRLVEDLLDVARVTQGRIVLRRERVALGTVVERAVEATRALLEARQHRLSVRLPAEPPEVEADPTRLEQVVVNLLGNAAKYSEPGMPIVVTLERQGDAAVLRVRDVGMGIAPEMLAHVFEPFAQSQQALERAEGGLGIGLTVVRTLIELHGGRVEARSEGPGAGAEFVVTLAALPPGAAPFDATRGTAPAARTPVRVLVVEDEPDVAESLVMLLRVLGHEAQLAPDGAAALRAAETETFDVVLLDVGLPGMDGFEVARRLRSAGLLRGARLLALTGYGREGDRERALAAGFDEHVVKPIDVDTLQTLLAGHRPADAGGAVRR